MSDRHVTGSLLDLEAQVAELRAAQADSERVIRELRANEARARALLDAIPDLMFRMNRAGVFVDYKAQPSDLFVPSAETIVGKKSADVMPPDFAGLLQHHVNTALDTGEMQVFEYQLPSPARGWRDYEARVIASGAEEVIAIVRDITARKAVMEALRESESRYRTLVESLPQKIFLKDRNSAYVSCNTSYARGLGIESLDIVGKSDYDFYPPEKAEQYRADDQRIMARGKAEEVEEQIVQEGQVHWVLVVKTPVWDGAGHVNGILGISWDITERKRAEQELEEYRDRLEEMVEVRTAQLRESEERQRAQYKSVPVPTYTWQWQGDDFIFVDYNDAARDLTQGKLARLLGVRASELYRDRPEMLANFSRCFVGRAAIVAEGWYQLEPLEDNRYLSIKYAFVPPDSVLVHIDDITERKRAEEQVARARDAAEAANRAKSAFLANMSHEFRTPLNVVLGFAQMMRRDPMLSPQQLDNLDVITRSGEHLLSLINDVLEISKIEAGRATLTESSFDLYILLGDLEDMFRPRAERKGLRFVFDLAADLPRYIKTDERKLRQVMINLLGNAIKFTQEGGVTLRVRADQASHSPVSLCFELQDSGVGIAPDEMDKLFEVFTQTASGRQAQEGAGLGLSISRQFVQLMGGDIAVSSQVGQGATFTFNILVQLSPAAERLSQPPARQVVGLEPDQPLYRILVVEDNLESRLLLRRLLEETGFAVQEAVNGQEAIEQCQHWRPHLVWMDMRMPVMDGYEATKRIKAAAPAPIVIALTASTFEDHRAVAFAVGCDDFVRKPFQESEIFEKMAHYLGVRYVYRELSPPLERAGAALPPPALPEDWALPADWSAALHRAAVRGKARQALDLIDQIRPEHATLAEALAGLVRDFRFDELATLMEKSLARGDGPEAERDEA